MTIARQQFGKFGEALAEKALKKRGYKILHTNYRTPLGEIDMIAEDAGTLVFVEVKARKSFAFGSAKQAVTPAKQRRISKNALYFLKSTGRLNVRARFDVVAISPGDDGGPSIEIIKNAFELIR